ncbi:winged helix-turn-helix transcriptional regulator [Brochothrix campestris]|uniref:HxlR family transcriptional regulator n=1 Tax=Brochothrix campestris FSL F6-1037 TaxID=1265861 RepID=W7CIM0_9LIST|nr:helix-turn-helix domain-containing protein [Brochothrix campestris]EUJ39234.1 HxlR family transcriptional regulator [Brochothrix campestris FSL F6-1037]
MITSEKLCPRFEEAYQLIGKRWTGLIIEVLLNADCRRFKEISELIPNMSDRVLAERLKELEAKGIVERKVYPETPVRIEYVLTQKGKDLQKATKDIHEWAEKWIEIPQTTVENNG